MDPVMNPLFVSTSPDIIIILLERHWARNLHTWFPSSDCLTSLSLELHVLSVKEGTESQGLEGSRILNLPSYRRAGGREEGLRCGHMTVLQKISHSSHLNLSLIWNNLCVHASNKIYCQILDSAIHFTSQKAQWVWNQTSQSWMFWVWSPCSRRHVTWDKSPSGLQVFSWAEHV